MPWPVEFTDEYECWFLSLTDPQQASVDAHVHMLEERGPTLPYPYSSGISGSRHGHMRELRVQHKGRPFRVLYAFDSRRVAILLIGGDKTGDDRWYRKFIQKADRIYDRHARALENKDKKNE
jgi:hypothetical protein